MSVHRCIGCDERLPGRRHGNGWPLCPECVALGIEVVADPTLGDVVTVHGSTIREACHSRSRRFIAAARDARGRAA